MVIPDSSVPSIPDMIFRQQVMSMHLPLGSIRRGPLAASPTARQIEARVAIDDPCNSRIQFLFADMLVVNPGEISGRNSREGPRHLGWTHLRPVGKDGEHLPQRCVLQLRFKSRERAKASTPVQPMLHMSHDLKQVDILEFGSQQLLQLLYPCWSI